MGQAELSVYMNHSQSPMKTRKSVSFLEAQNFKEKSKKNEIRRGSIDSPG